VFEVPPECKQQQQQQQQQEQEQEQEQEEELGSPLAALLAAPLVEPLVAAAAAAAMGAMGAGGRSGSATGAAARAPAGPPLPAQTLPRLGKRAAAAVPDAFDARELGWVTRVRDQGSCGGCWAFSSAAALEVLIARKLGATTPVPHLAPQALIDCVPYTVQSSLQPVIGVKGCNGGWPATAMAAIAAADRGGMPLETAYRYAAVDGMCQAFDPYPYASNASSSPLRAGAAAAPMWNVTAAYLPNDAATIAAAVVERGAVLATVQILSDFTFYSDGIYDQPQCTGAVLSHAVLIVGFGKDSTTGKEYWIVKNSFGQAWGEDGYIRMVRGKNMCGIEKNWPLAVSLN
jgi:C1A family cysteine protease